MIRLTVNGKEQELDVDPQTPCYGFYESNCASRVPNLVVVWLSARLTVHVNGTAQRSCVTPLGSGARSADYDHRRLAPSEDELHFSQQAWIDEQVPQCGCCQSGQLMSAASLLASNANPSDEEINAAMQGNICRCGMYGRIKKAINRVAGVGYFDPARGGLAWVSGQEERSLQPVL